MEPSVDNTGRGPRRTHSKVRGLPMRPLTPTGYADLPIYPPGKPIAETAREFGLDPSCIAKLASNENSLGPSPKALEAIRAALPELHLYPDGSAHYLKEALCSHYRTYGLTHANLITANGTNDIIDLMMKSLLLPGEKIAVWTPTFIIYSLCSRSHGRGVVEVPMGADFTYNLEAMVEAVHADRSIKAVFIANPNNPTGSWVGADFIGELIARIPDDVVFILDEAYKEFVSAEDEADGVALALGRPRTLTLRTFSKAYGLAGVRVGYGIAQKEVVAAINKARPPFNCNSLAQVAGAAALEDQDFIERSRALVLKQIPIMRKRFADYGLTSWPSQTNFILVDFGEAFEPLFQKFLALGVILRPMTGYGMPTCARINVGTDLELERLWSACDKVL
jgi:histidinol-phosphate aminotransferase